MLQVDLILLVAGSYIIPEDDKHIRNRYKTMINEHYSQHGKTRHVRTSYIQSCYVVRPAYLYSLLFFKPCTNISLVTDQGYTLKKQYYI